MRRSRPNTKIGRAAQELTARDGIAVLVLFGLVVGGRGGRTNHLAKSARQLADSLLTELQREPPPDTVH